GGSVCPGCENAEVCIDDGDCKSNNCVAGGQGGGGGEGGAGATGICEPCADDDGCPTGTYCSVNAANVVCVPEKANGESCDLLGECASGNCVEGVCCDAECDGGCESCLDANTGQGDGTCSPASPGTDPKNFCTANPSTC